MLRSSLRRCRSSRTLRVGLIARWNAGRGCLALIVLLAGSALASGCDSAALGICGTGAQLDVNGEKFCVFAPSEGDPRQYDCPSALPHRVSVSGGGVVCTAGDYEPSELPPAVCAGAGAPVCDGVDMDAGPDGAAMVDASRPPPPPDAAAMDASRPPPPPDAAASDTDVGDADEPPCAAEESRACGAGEVTAEPSLCRRGSQTCVGGAWGSCTGAVEPVPEDCSTTADDDCDGDVNEDCTPLDLESGQLHSCVVVSTGAVQCWGSNMFGQLGDESWAASRSTPTPMHEAGVVADVAPANIYTCVVAESGGVACTGAGYAPAGGPSNRLADIAGVAGAVAVSHGTNFACAATAGGEVLCWGNNDEGQLGDGTTTGRRDARVVVGLVGDAVDLAVGDAHACALLSDRTLQCWGRNDRSQLGDGTTVSPRRMPVAVIGVEDVVQVEAARDRTLAVRGDGTVLCWGDSSHGECQTMTADPVRTPVVLSGTGAVSRVDCFLYHVCALERSGRVLCWGDNGDGQLGDGTRFSSLSPVAVTGIDDAADIAVGGRHSCALRGDGSVVCWGDNSSGQLGDGSADAHLDPAPVIGLRR